MIMLLTKVVELLLETSSAAHSTVGLIIYENSSLCHYKHAASATHI